MSDEGLWLSSETIEELEDVLDDGDTEEALDILADAELDALFDDRRDQW